MSSNNRVLLDWNLNPRIPVPLRIMVHIRRLGNEVFRCCHREKKIILNLIFGNRERRQQMLMSGVVGAATTHSSPNNMIPFHSHHSVACVCVYIEQYQLLQVISFFSISIEFNGCDHSIRTGNNLELEQIHPDADRKNIHLILDHNLPMLLSA